MQKEKPPNQGDRVALDADTMEVLGIVSEPVQGAGLEDRCKIELELGRQLDDGDLAPTTINLIPANPRATRLGIQLDHEAQITFYVGRRWSVAETFDKDRSKLLADVRSFVLLALSGNYHEYVKELEGEDHQAISRFSWPDDGRPGGFSYNVLLPRRWSTLGRKGWTEEVYEPY